MQPYHTPELAMTTHCLMLQAYANRKPPTTAIFSQTQTHLLDLGVGVIGVPVGVGTGGGDFKYLNRRDRQGIGHMVSIFA